MGLLSFLPQDLADRVLFDRRLRIAVTGLSRSGKTVFLTSLINILENIARSNNHNLKLLQTRIHSVEVITKGFAKVFPYDTNLKALKETPPAWPIPTDDFSEIRLRIKLHDQAGILEKNLSSSKDNKRTIDIDLIDYPGEWLLDLQLLDFNYKMWSKEVDFNDPIRRELSKEFQAKLTQLDLQSSYNKQQIHEISSSYIKYLKACKAQGLNFLQPGHFLHQDEQIPQDDFLFFPLSHLSDAEFDALEMATAKQPDSTFQKLQQAYENYKKNYVNKFYKDHFSRFDRQIVLVDCLTPLNYSRHAFSDTQRALNFIFGHFNYGSRKWYHRLFNSKIDKVMFVATKVDYIAAHQVKQLEELFHDLLASVRESMLNNLQSNSHAVVASIRSLVTQRDGNLIYLSGNLATTPYHKVSFFPATLPTRIPDASYWETRRPSQLVIHDANQSILDYDGVYNNFLPLPLKDGMVQQINMEQVICEILGDKLFDKK